MNRIKLFITDIDGVWTDGGMYYDEAGNEFKKFNTADSAGVLFLHLLNLPVAIVTGETTNMVKRRSEKLKVDYLFMGISNKLEVATKLCSDLQITLDEAAYIGDDINDIALLQKVGLSAAPDNAPDYVKQKVNWVIPVKGGDGAFRAFVEKYLKEMNLLESTVEKFILNNQSLKQ
jgi:3-deoxy-D-manno-octulosonate 8-phosphate phosphatase (KDO 8-P phosphatase)